MGLKTLINIAVALFTFPIFAGTLFISDVDDTLKNSKVRNPIKIIEQAFKTGKRVMVPGMNLAFQEMVRADDAQGIYYVSKIPSFLSYLHVAFLTKNDFPGGYLVTRKLERDFKYQNIGRIIVKEAPTRVVLIGDNGEADAKVYLRLKRAFKGENIEFKIFIRKAYPDNIKYTNQIQYFKNGRGLLKLLSKNGIIR
ncbi:MAG: phosphatase domain-containing protein [Bdellovibrionales bacterium]